MSDIKERLRRIDGNTLHLWDNVFAEAADEIERLERDRFDVQMREPLIELMRLCAVGTIQAGVIAAAATIKHQHKELERLERELAQRQEDAERYRWLTRGRYWGGDVIDAVTYGPKTAADAAIDAARASAKVDAPPR